MKISSTETFTWIHKGIAPIGSNEDTREMYDLGPDPVEMTDEAYAHLISVFGDKMFTVSGSDKKPKKEKEA